MKAIAWSTALICLFIQTAVFAASSQPTPPPATCVDLTGTYRLPLGEHDRSDDPPLLMIDQDHCRLINLVVGYGGFVPIGEDSSLDGSDGYFIIGNTIVEKGQGGTLSLPTSHGHCSAYSVAMSLDANGNMVFTSPKVFNCKDKYRGPLNETFPRVSNKPYGATVQMTAASESGPLTCTDKNGRSLKVVNGSVIFQGLDSAGIRSAIGYEINDSEFNQVPGMPLLIDYFCANGDQRVHVRFSQSSNKTSAQVWLGKAAEGETVFAGACIGTL